MAKSRQRDGYFLFWSEWPSNWTSSPFKIDGVRYGCVEQYMMAEKARLFGDTKSLKRIMDASNPADQKRYGRAVSPYSEDKWAKVRYEVVLRATLEKYRQNPDLKKKLLDAGDVTFVEASPQDKVWGIGLDAEHPCATSPKQWRGLNLLGKAITEARRIIVNEDANP